LERAVTPRPPDDGHVVGRARDDRVALRVHGGRDDRHVRVDLPRVVGQVLVARHHVRGEAADRPRLPRKLQVAQVAVGRADVALEDRVVEVEDEGDARARERVLEERRPEQRRLAQDVDGVEVARVAHVAPAARECRRDEPHLRRQLSRLVEDFVQLRRLERAVRDADAALAQQRLPLLDAVTLARVAVVDAGDDCKQAHGSAL
jgi:hypothetical protein